MHMARAHPPCSTHARTQFHAFLDSRGFRSVATCPEVYRQHSSRRLLVMERLRGVPLTDYAAIRSITTKASLALGVAVCVCVCVCVDARVCVDQGESVCVCARVCVC